MQKVLVARAFKGYSVPAMKTTIKCYKPEANRPFLKIFLSTDGSSTGPYFSVTGEMKDCCGCIHEDILKERPDLAPLVALHLSDLDGVPMHAVENGFYWLAKAAGIPMRYEPDQDAATCREYFMNHCRIGLSEAEFILEHVLVEYALGGASVATSSEVTERCKQEMSKAGEARARAYWNECARGMASRWKSEAKAGLELLDKLVKEG